MPKLIVESRVTFDVALIANGETGEKAVEIAKAMTRSMIATANGKRPETIEIEVFNVTQADDYN